jgi:hypothetical protein
MKIAVPTQSISKSLFIAKRKDSDDLELLFYAPSSIDETFFKLDDDFHFSYLSYNLSNAITPVEEIYDIAFFLPTLLAFVKEEDKDDPELFKDLFLSKLNTSQLEYYIEYINYVKLKRQLSRAISRFLAHFKKLIENGEVSPIKFEDIYSNKDEYQLAFGEALINKHMDGIGSFVEVNTLLANYLNEASKNPDIPEVSIEMPIRFPRKSKSILRLNLFEKIRYYLWLL